MPKPLVELSEDKKKELWESFNLLDPEGTGKLIDAYYVLSQSNPNPCR